MPSQPNVQPRLFPFSPFFFFFYFNENNDLTLKKVTFLK